MHLGHGRTKSRGATVAATTGADGAVTLTLNGELDHEGVAAIEGEVHRAAATAQGHLALDAHDVTFVDSAGLRLILQAQMTTTSRGVAFLLARPAPNVVRLLELTGLDDLIDTGSAAH